MTWVICRTYGNRNPNVKDDRVPPSPDPGMSRRGKQRHVTATRRRRLKPQVEPPARCPSTSERAIPPNTMSNSLATVTRQMSALDLNKQQSTKPTAGTLRKQPSQTNVSKMLSKYAAPAPGHTRSNSASTRLPQKPLTTAIPPPVKKVASATSLNKSQKPKFVPTKSTVTTVKKKPSTLTQTAKPKVAPVKPSESRSKSPTETIASTTSSSQPELTPSPLLSQPSANEIGSYDGGLENDAAVAAREPASEETEELLNINSSYSE